MFVKQSPSKLNQPWDYSIWKGGPRTINIKSSIKVEFRIEGTITIKKEKLKRKRPKENQLFRKIGLFPSKSHSKGWILKQGQFINGNEIVWSFQKWLLSKSTSIFSWCVKD